MTAASSVARGLHCASLLRWVESEEGVNDLGWIVNLVLLSRIKGYFTGHTELRINANSSYTFGLMTIK